MRLQCSKVALLIHVKWFLHLFSRDEVCDKNLRVDPLRIFLKFSWAPSLKMGSVLDLCKTYYVIQKPKVYFFVARYKSLLIAYSLACGNL